MFFDNTYLMLLYFKNKNKINTPQNTPKNMSPSKIVTFNEKVHIISNISSENPYDSDDTYDKNRYPYNKKNIIIK